jgi:hypothetical protein
MKTYTSGAPYTTHSVLHIRSPMCYTGSPTHQPPHILYPQSKISGAPYVIHSVFHIRSPMYYTSSLNYTSGAPASVQRTRSFASGTPCPSCSPSFCSLNQANYSLNQANCSLNQANCSLNQTNCSANHIFTIFYGPRTVRLSLTTHCSWDADTRAPGPWPIHTSGAAHCIRSIQIGRILQFFLFSFFLFSVGWPYLFARDPPPFACIRGSAYSSRMRTGGVLRQY